MNGRSPDEPVPALLDDFIKGREDAPGRSFGRVILDAFSSETGSGQFITLPARCIIVNMAAALPGYP
jgi:hypothetical protein